MFYQWVLFSCAIAPSFSLIFKIMLSYHLGIKTLFPKMFRNKVLEAGMKVTCEVKFPSKMVGELRCVRLG